MWNTSNPDVELLPCNKFIIAIIAGLQAVANTLNTLLAASDTAHKESNEWNTVVPRNFTFYG